MFEHDAKNNMTKDADKAVYMRSRKSFASQTQDIARHDRLDGMSGELRQSFDAECYGDGPGHGSEMVKRQQPRPVLRPTAALSLEPDRAAFDRRMRADDAAARDDLETYKIMRRHMQRMSEIDRNMRRQYRS